MTRKQIKQIRNNKTTIEQKNVFNSAINDRLKNIGNMLSTYKGNRDMYSVLGYKESPTETDYFDRYKRQDIAKRIIEAYPDACWQEKPIITDDENTQEQTDFERQVEELFENNKIRGISTSKKLDILANIGSYCALYIAIADGKNPIEPLEGSFKSKDVLFLAPYSQRNIAVSKWEQNPESPRYGKPALYTLEANSVESTRGINTINQKQSLLVHHTRILHIAEGSLENPLIGTPRLESVLNRLDDLEKVVGGGAETYWLNARGGLHINVESDSLLNSEQSEQINEMLQNFSNTLTRFIKTQNVQVTPINHTVSDPLNHFDTIISLIASATKIPKRILIGSEVGSLASTQDEDNWIAKVRSRQLDFCEYSILRPLIDFFILYGILPAPTRNKYVILWPDLQKISDSEKADIALKQMTATEKYLGGRSGAELLIPEKQFVEDFLHVEYREADLGTIEQDIQIDDGNELT